MPQGARSKAEALRAQQRAEERPKGEPVLERDMKHLKPESAVRVYERANPGERRRVLDMVLDRIDRSRVLTEEDKAVLQGRVEKASR
jgi:hypothetical protein